MDKSLWRGVISSIEETALLYDEVNEIIRLRRANKARAHAARRLMESNPRLVFLGEFLQIRMAHLGFHFYLLSCEAANRDLCTRF